MDLLVMANKFFSLITPKLLSPLSIQINRHLLSSNHRRTNKFDLIIQPHWLRLGLYMISSVSHVVSVACFLANPLLKILRVICVATCPGMPPWHCVGIPWVFYINIKAHYDILPRTRHDINIHYTASDWKLCATCWSNMFVSLIIGDKGDMSWTHGMF